MKLSILTATYNRANFLEKLYNSILKNLDNNLEVEWLIMDDGSNDETQEIIKKFKNKSNFVIKSFKQHNQGKMQAINNLMKYANGECIIECDSDDIFMENSLKIIKSKMNILLENENLYALVFLKKENENKLSGNKFKYENVDTTMFDLYFKQEIFGEKILLYKSSIRKQYEYILENNERFCTEARMHHKIDLNYNVRCFNEALIQGQYQSDGYTKNIKKVFLDNPIGFYKYFQEILERKTKGITIKKRMYVIKQYILFTYLSKKSISISSIEELINKILVIMLYIPGIYKSRKFLKEYNNRS